MLEPPEYVYVTDKQLRAFRDTLQRMHDDKGQTSSTRVLLTDMMYALEDELDERREARQNAK